MFSWCMILGQTIMMFLIFATQENVNNLIQYREWFADGTFNIVPYPFSSDIYHPLFMPRYNTSDGLLFLRRKNNATDEEFLSWINNVWLWKSVSSGTQECFWRKRKYNRMLFPSFPNHMVTYSKPKFSGDVQREWRVKSKDENIGWSCICTT